MWRYAALLLILTPFALIITTVHAVKRRGGFTFFAARFGLTTPTATQVDYLIHAASIGEVVAATPLINALHQQRKTVALSTTTPTGFERAQTNLPDDVLCTYLPIDYRLSIHRFLNRLRPQQVLVVETEIWPNFFAEAVKHGKLSIINARLSPKTLNAPQWIKNILGTALTHVDQILARDDDEKIRFESLGVLNDKVHVLPNLKFAQSPESFNPPIDTPYVLAMSTHDDEELLIAHAMQSQAVPLVIIPRHVERAAHIKKQLSQAKLSATVIKQSGVARAYIEHATLVLIGGAWVEKGGQNILEPAMYGKAVVCGPHMYNFASEVTELKAADALIQCEPEALAITLESLLSHPSQMEAHGTNAQALMRLKRDKTLSTYLKHL